LPGPGLSIDVTADYKNMIRNLNELTLLGSVPIFGEKKLGLRNKSAVMGSSRNNNSWGLNYSLSSFF